MLTKAGEIIGGPVYFLLAATIGLIGYAVGIAGGYMLSVAVENVFEWTGAVVAAALGGMCSGAWPTFLRRKQRKYLLMAALPIGAIAAGLSVSFIAVPALTGSPRLDAVFLGALIGGASAMMLLMPIPNTQAQKVV